MVTIVHEVWITFDDEGKELPSCIHAGSLGDEARKLLIDDGAKLEYRFLADNHFDAMSKFHLKMHQQIYPNTFSEPWDFEPYPEEWAAQQQRDGIKIINFE